MNLWPLLVLALLAGCVAPSSTSGPYQATVDARNVGDEHARLNVELLDARGDVVRREILDLAPGEERQVTFSVKAGSHSIRTVLPEGGSASGTVGWAAPACPHQRVHAEADGRDGISVRGECA